MLYRPVRRAGGRGRLLLALGVAAGAVGALGLWAGPAAAAKRPPGWVGKAGVIPRPVEALVPATVAPATPAPAPPADAHGIPVAPSAPAAATGAEITHPGPGYWLIGGDGGVFPFGRGAYEGGMAERSTNAPIVGAAVTPSGVGYWLASSDGGVFAFGDAKWHGSLPARQIAGFSRVAGIASTPTGAGYWLAGSDGGVFAFGDAGYAGSMGGRHLSAPITGIAATPTGKGYWLVGGDGAVYAYGDARYFGGAGSVSGYGRIVALAPTSTGAGYWLAGADGGVYAFGDARFFGSLADRPHARIVGLAAAPQGGGYWLAGSDGGVFGFGTADYFGSVGGSRLNRGVVGIASGDGIAIPRAPTAPDSTSGFDISWPQCQGFHPAPPYGFGLVGITDGHLFSVNPCIEEQWGWATAYGSFAAVYVNTNAPDAAELAAFSQTTALPCGPNTGCALDLWGRRGVDQALRAASKMPAPMWWLDVETGNEWLPDPNANAVILRAMIDELQKAGKRVGIYSTSRQWTAIAAGYAPGLPLWVPGAPPSDPASYCAGQSFGGGMTWMAQSGDANFDTDVLCAAGLNAYREAFAAPAPLPVPQYGAPQPAPVPAPADHDGALGQAVSALGRDARGAEGVAVLATTAGGGSGTTRLEWLLVLVAGGVLAWLGVAGSRRGVGSGSLAAARQGVGSLAAARQGVGSLAGAGTAWAGSVAKAGESRGRAPLRIDAPQAAARPVPVRINAPRAASVSPAPSRRPAARGR